MYDFKNSSIYNIYIQGFHKQIMYRLNPVLL